MGHIQVQDICKEYKNRRRRPRKNDHAGLHLGDRIDVLDHINLDFEDGEMVCILGPSGCGKSTLLRIIAGFEAPTTGQVVIDGQPVSGPGPNHIFVFQHSGLLPWMTVYQNVELGQRHIQDISERDATIREYIEMVELDSFENHFPHQLSGGMQRRAELARALSVNPEILIMDEPFSGLDFLTHMKMREEVVNMHQFIGKTTLVVTHDIDDALVMGDRIVVMDDRPATVAMNQQLDFPHPRKFDADSGLSDIRDELFLMLGVSYAV